VLGIEREPTYQERKLAYDQERVRLRLDVPQWLKDGIEGESKELRVSMSQLSAFFLAYALKLYRDGDPALLELMADAKTQIASLRWAFGLDLADLADALTESSASLDLGSL
jgi:hypothetical protein